ncbi:MAG: hypothetical protein QOJ15_939 [Bradyrhizobium sp.]|nr:hypothetical protein [Bradyrhizobium sp.]
MALLCLWRCLAPWSLMPSRRHPLLLLQTVAVSPRLNRRRKAPALRKVQLPAVRPCKTQALALLRPRRLHPAQVSEATFRRKVLIALEATWSK